MRKNHYASIIMMLLRVNHIIQNMVQYDNPTNYYTLLDDYLIVFDLKIPECF